MNFRHVRNAAGWCLLFIGAPLVAFAQAHTPPTSTRTGEPVTIRETELYRVQGYGSVMDETFLVSPDGKRAACVLDCEEDTYMAWIDGHTHGRQDDVTELTFSPDGARLAYIINRGEDCEVVVEGMDSITGFRWPRDLLFSPDGRHLAFQAEREPKPWRSPKRTHVVVLDGQVVARDLEGVGTLAFSPDSQHLAFVSRAAGGERVWWRGNLGKRYDAIWRLDLTAEGELTYWAKDGHAWLPVNETTEDRSRACLGDRPPLFTPDGRRSAYTVTRDGVCRLFVDEKPIDEYDAVPYLLFSPDGKRLACIAERAGRQFVVVDGAAGRPYEKVSRLQFSTDGLHLSYVASRDTQQRAVIDGIEGPPWAEIDGLVHFSPGASHTVYAARRTKREKNTNSLVLVVDGYETGAYHALPSGSRVIFDGPDRFHFVATRIDEWNLAVLRVDVTFEQHAASAPADGGRASSKPGAGF